MALVLNTNSYVAIADADTYFETRIDSANWESAEDELKEQALVTATQMVDENAWLGSAVSSSQALAWPRKNVIYYSNKMGQQISIANDVIPTQVKIAVYEQAFHLVNNEDVLMGQTQTYESISIGSISLSDSNGDVTRVPKKPAEALKPIKELIHRGRSGGMGGNWWRAN
mgnify:CR=1 FL=1